ncbi:MAG: RluA family pseudouridine synthase [bacterium]
MVDARRAVLQNPPVAVQLSVSPNERVPCPVVHEDDHFLVVAKPPGVVTQPGVGHQHDTVLNALFASHGKILQNLGRGRDFGLIHRLDRPTSGLLVVGLTPEGYDGIRAQFEARTIGKTYVAVVAGVPRPAEDAIRVPLAEVRRGGRKESVPNGPGAQAAETRYRVVSAGPEVALLECDLRTGRLHQIRAHLTYRGHPILGDRDYGPKIDLDRAWRQAAPASIGLHAGGLSFVHPVHGHRLTVRAPLPAPALAFLADQGVSVPRRWR